MMVRQKRDELEERARRVQRIVALTAELRSFGPELERLDEKDDQGPRYQELRDRTLAIQAELEELKPDGYRRSQG